MSLTKLTFFTLLIVFLAISPLQADTTIPFKSEEQRIAERREIAAHAAFNNTSVEDVADNPRYVGQAVEWEGYFVFSDTKHRNVRYFANSNRAIKAENNMSFVFGIVFPQALPADARISVYSTRIYVKGKIIAVEKLFNNRTFTFSSHRQPIVEAAEVTFSREPYNSPLTIRYY